MQGFEIDREVDQGIEPLHRVPIAHLWSFDAQFFGLTVDALTRCSLGINGLVEGAITIKRHAHETSWLHVDVLDTAFGGGKLSVVTTGSFTRRRKVQGAAIELSTIAIGMGKDVGGMHAQAFGTQGNAIGVAFKGGMSMLILGNGGDAAVQRTFLVDVPRVISSISGGMGGKEA